MMHAARIGALLRAERESARLSQRELAVRAGVDRSWISRAESGRRVPDLGMLERVLASVGRQLRLETEPLWADVDRQIARMRSMSVDDRLRTSAVWFAMWRMELGSVDYVVGGAFAALAQGAPVPAQFLDVIVAEASVPAVRETFLRTNGLERWDERLGDWTCFSRDLAEPGSKRWRSIGGELRLHIVRSLPAAQSVMIDGELTAMLSHYDIESADPEVARVLARLRSVRAGTTAPQEPVVTR